MRIFKRKKRIREHCQHCKYGNNEKGKHIYHWYRKAIFFKENEKGKLKRDPDKEGYWHVFCEKKQKWVPWIAYKRCFERNEELRLWRE